MNAHDTAEAGVAAALSLIRSRYEGNGDPDQDMPFHCAEHTAGVVRRAEALLLAMAAGERDRLLGRVAAAFHDTVQRWEDGPAAAGRVLRKRLTGRNEIDSAAEATDWMRAARGFDERDCELVRRAILATVPGWDAENRTVWQPNLTPDAPAVVRAVALADLGIAGMDGAAFVEAGDQLFREDNLDIARAIRRCADRPGLSEVVLEGYKARVLAWCRSQVAFAQGRRGRLPLELGDLGGTARAAVGGLFCLFDEAAAASEAAARLRDALPAWEVARAAGYALPGEGGR